VYTAVDVAKYIVTKCIKENTPITNLQLQKILYYIQRDYLQNVGLGLFPDNFEAWRFGPVVPSVYYVFSRYGSQPITKEYPNIEIEEHDCELIDPIVEKKRLLNPWDMVEDVHKTGGAWDQVFKGGEGFKSVIPNELIKAVG